MALHLQRATRSTTTDQAYESILAAILDGSVTPGARLGLHQLANDLGTSMQPIREALRRLEAIGLIDVEAHRGARVRPLDDDDLVDTYRTRCAIEGLLVERAAAQFTAADEEAARHAIEQHRMAAEAGDRVAARDAHQSFHFSIYHAARSPWLFRSAMPTWHNSERYRLQSTTSLSDATQRRAEHDELLGACVRHDAVAARDALQRHLLGTVHRYSPVLAERLA